VAFFTAASRERCASCDDVFADCYGRSYRYYFNELEYSDGYANGAIESLPSCSSGAGSRWGYYPK
jgi:hypothetical protein